MNDMDIQQFMKAFKDFMKHSEVQELYYESEQVYREHAQQIQSDIEQKAAELEITVDYYLMEFV